MYTNIIDVLENAPKKIIMQDSFTKAFSMLTKYDTILCEMDEDNDATKVILDIIKICDFNKKVEYTEDAKKDYDLVICPARKVNSPHESCSGYGEYRPVFWYSDEDLQDYIKWMEERDDYWSK